MPAADFTTTVLLLQRAQSGQRQALDDLLARYAPRVRDALALTLGRVPRGTTDLDDVVQEALLAAFQKFDRYEMRSDASFLGWLLQLALNKARDLGRHAGRMKRGGGRVGRLEDLAATTSTPQLPALGPSPSVVARAHELADAEQQALVQLPDHYREILVLHDVLGMSHDEIAPQLGYKTDAPSRAHYNRAKKKLAEALQRFE